MNNSKIWLVVNPTIGLPIFLGAVAVGSFAVHVGVVTNTDWIAEFHSGQEMTDLVIEGDRNTAALASGQELLVTLPDGRVATAVIRDVAPQTASTAVE